MAERIPTYTVVGHPNEGKSSVVATLTENDSIRISPIPGETTVRREFPVQIDGQTVIRFVDTPGFQYPRKILEWIREHETAVSDLLQTFIIRHTGEEKLAHDLELLRPLREGCGVIYVIDGSRPISSSDRIEMEILRLIGNPRMAVINPKGENDNYLTQWKTACSKTFNSIRMFDAHRATYSERIALLESLKGINQEWEGPLAEAIEAFQQDWQARIQQVAGILCELLRKSITHAKSKLIFSPELEEPTKKTLLSQYQSSLHKLENASHERIRQLFKHNIFNVDIPPQSILHEDLFTGRTWQALGLTRKQVISTAALLGGGLGAKLDILAAGLTFGVFTVSGALAGAATAWLKGERLARTEIKKQKLGGIKITIGPNTNAQFPFILLDRALLYFQHITNWAHARSKNHSGDSAAVNIGSDKEVGYTSQWSHQQRKICATFLKAVSTEAPFEKQDEAERACRSMLEGVLSEITSGTAQAVPDESQKTAS